MQKNIIIMYLTALLQGMVFYAPIAALYRTAVGITISQIAVIESISLILSFIFELPWGIFADHIGYKKTIVLCNFLYFISKLIFWKSTGFSFFLIERIILAIVISGLSGVDASILYLSVPAEKSYRTFGIYNALSTFGLITASLVYSIFIGNNYRLAAALTTFTYGIATLISLGLKEVKRIKSNTFSLKQMLLSLKSTFSDQKLIFLLLAAALFTQVHQSVTVFFIQLKLFDISTNNRIIGFIHILLTVAGLVSAFSYRITGKHYKTAPFILSLLAFCSCIVLVYTSSYVFATIAAIVLQGAFSIFLPLQTDVENRLANVNYRATALSINSAIKNSTAAGLSVILGFAAEKNLSVSFLLCAFLCLLSAVLIKMSKGRTL